jgi:hypothetical protein
MIRLGMTLALSAGLLLLRGRRLRGRRWETLAILLIVADLVAFGWGLAPGTDSSVYRGPVASAEFLQDQPPGRIFVTEPYAQETYDQYVSLSAFGSTDPGHLQGLRESLMPNLNSEYHLPGVGNYDPLTVGAYQDLYELLEGEPGAPAALEQNRPLLNLFGARYLITADELELPLLYDAGPMIYANDEALPAAWVVHRARAAEDEQARLDALRDPDFDPRVEVLLSLGAGPSPVPNTATVESEIPLVLRRGPDRVIIEVDMAQPGYLVLADTYYPGWTATANGEAVEILSANHAFRAIQLDEGHYTVVFQYAPRSFGLGAWITAVGALMLAAALIIGILRGRTRFVEDGRSS